MQTPARAPTRRAASLSVGAALVAPAIAHAARPLQLLGAGADYGWAAFDMSTGKASSTNPDMRFPMCSSFKWLVAACVLARVDAGQETLARGLSFGPADLVPSSSGPAALLVASSDRPSLSLDQLCSSAVEVSDSTAANLLLRTIGGPAGLTAWLRTQGDPVTRLDRTELALNRVGRGDARDTTTPAAMLGNLHRILFGKTLSPSSRARLFGWMLECQTGPTRLKAGLPPSWRIAHKTGTWIPSHGHGAEERSASGDVGVLIPPVGGPVLIAAYAAGSERPQPDIDRWFAEVARSVAAKVESRRRAGA
ncbi:MAG: Beta-lactamase [Caulobacteraceae bacterium]|nr:Beta-lactamase [Caulobacteraceae bacterium]